MASPNRNKKTGKLSLAAERYQILKDNNDITFKIDLRKKISRANEKKIKRYFDEVSRLRAGAIPVARYKPKNKKEAAAMREYTGVNTRLRGLNGILWPKYTNDTKLEFYKGSDGKTHARVKLGNIRIEKFWFDRVQLASRGMDYVREVLDMKKIEMGKPVTFYRILTGEYEINSTFRGEGLDRAMSSLLDRYGDNGSKLHATGRNHFTKWLVGVQKTTTVYDGSQAQVENAFGEIQKSTAVGKAAIKRRFDTYRKAEERKRKKNKRG